MAKKKSVRQQAGSKKAPNRSVKPKKATSAISSGQPKRTTKPVPAVDAINAEAEAILKWFCVAWHVVSYARGKEQRDSTGIRYKVTELIDQLMIAANDYINLQLCYQSNNRIKRVLLDWAILTGPNSYRSKCAVFAAEVVRIVNPFGSTSVCPAALDNNLKKQLIARWRTSKKELKNLPALDVDSLLRAFAHERELAGEFARARTVTNRQSVEGKCRRLPKWDKFLQTVIKVRQKKGSLPPLDPVQQAVLKALNGHAYTAEALADKVGTHKQRLYRKSCLEELRNRGSVKHDPDLGGFYRPDAPPLQT